MNTVYCQRGPLSAAKAIALGATLLVVAPAGAHDEEQSEHLFHPLLDSCADELSNSYIPIHRGIPAGQLAAIIPPWFTGAGQVAESVLETCAGFNWVRVFGGPDLTVSIFPEPTYLPVNEGDCDHSSLAWALYAQTTSGEWVMAGGGGLLGDWENERCVWNNNQILPNAEWGNNIVTNTVPNSNGQYRVAFRVWQHNDESVGHSFNYCSDPESCYSGASIWLNGTVQPPRQDYTIWRPSTGTWSHLDSDTLAATAHQWGLNGDQPLSIDFDGDSQSDYTVFRPSEGVWYIIFSSDGYGRSYIWGESGDIPVTADFDGDARGDMSVWRPSTGTWWIIRTSTWTYTKTTWGVEGDVPAAADYTGDGMADLMIWRPSSGKWYLIDSTTGSKTARTWGVSGDIPVPGDYDGDRRVDRAVWRASNGRWYWISSSTGGMYYRTWGVQGDIPVPGDGAGTGVTDPIVWRPSDGDWWALHGNSTYTRTQWGADGDVPLSLYRN